eukprot:Clim_evm16s66 gene=Clim_evmTU16s66
MVANDELQAAIPALGKTLADAKAPLNDRFRALFTLKNIGGKGAIDAIAAVFGDESALLKHELAYCLGQMQDPEAVPCLEIVLADMTQDPMVRHEAAEALGAIASDGCEEILVRFKGDPRVEVSETVEIALDRLRWLKEGKVQEDDKLSQNPYSSVDPAPPTVAQKTMTTAELKDLLCDESKSLFERYRSMFELRNRGQEDDVHALVEGMLKASSALFRHEVAYVLGQMQHPASVSGLSKVLENSEEHGMVRHEAAEALGSVATKEAEDVLRKYIDDSEQVVKESCLVALDITEHEKSGDFQYANGVSKGVTTDA